LCSQFFEFAESVEQMLTARLRAPLGAESLVLTCREAQRPERHPCREGEYDCL
jgi:hypothetical protein